MALSAAIVVVLVIAAGVTFALLNTKPSTPSTSPSNPVGSPSRSTSPAAVALPDGHGKTIKVWLTTDAKSWPGAVAAATAAFTKKTGAKVSVSYFDWSSHLTKFDAALNTSTAPDVVELGNTETPKYVFSGALADLTAQVPTFDNSATWLAGLAQPCQSGRKTYCVPYYAGARVLIYRTDLFASAGITPPTTYDELVTAAGKLRDAGVASPFYLPGRYWYAAMAFVYGKGGAIATQATDGSWHGGLSSPQAEAGLTDFATVAGEFSADSATLTEGNQDTVFAGGSVAMMYGNQWEIARVQSLAGGALKGKVAAVPLPGYTADRPMPSGLGGSALAVTAKSANQALAAEWIRDFTSTGVEKQLVASGALPNSTVLLGTGGPGATQAEAAAAMYSWATPMSPRWADVERAGIIAKMLQTIVTGGDVDNAARDADAQIEKLLNSA
jgi:N,N'-diacetylchitobiose transport system substrate-binding protein